jgi:predicted CXXCH cytochrome family protein
MMTLKHISCSLIFILFTVFLHTGAATAQEIGDCTVCHKYLGNKKYVHTIMQSGCTACHTEPHNKKSKYPKGLLAPVNEVCYACHDKSKYTVGESVHQPVASGMCSSCHDPHSSDTQLLLRNPQPDLCFDCHDKKLVAGTNVHAPVASGQCTSCHAAHVTENKPLLTKPINQLCIVCHRPQATGKHVISLPGGRFHPLRGVTDPNFPGKTMRVPDPNKPGKMMTVADPNKPGKELSCASCHNAHASNYGKLFPAARVCQKCHKY